MSINQIHTNDLTHKLTKTAEQNIALATSGRIAKLAVYGKPIEQSKSPIIHQMFAEQFDITISYEKIHGEPSTFLAQLDNFFAQETAIGANVTMPFKELAANWAQHQSKEVQQASAANTLVKVGREFFAQTTDGKGLVSDLLRNEMQLRNKTILLIGAGGAARGAISALLQEQPRCIHITNRTKANAQRLVDAFVDERVMAIAESDCSKHQYDLIVNATSLSLQQALPNLDDSLFAKHTDVYDMVYQSQDTVFVAHAKKLGCKNAIDGLGMLVGQAAESFYLWFGRRPNVEPVLSYLREELRAGN
ncbi:shikimate dehydrogenase [Glaciecola sp. MH2013]|uniref:shikimate dehydrogenase n=1 Tax=Glaciecola sp. MH2013 TaxID=2785524 RepID=UPI00189DE42F|nr:shikimate dehydrogenase [Glaciecola sp. MH2013]MBF7074683.1 shikimate dehydrogenase [Glaciecola sp. MH2013]